MGKSDDRVEIWSNSSGTWCTGQIWRICTEDETVDSRDRTVHFQGEVKVQYTVWNGAIAEKWVAPRNFERLLIKTGKSIITSFPEAIQGGKDLHTKASLKLCKKELA